MDCDSFVLSIETKNIIKNLKNLEHLSDISNLDKNHELFGNKDKKLVSKFKKETPKSNFVDELICLRSKACSFKCNDENTKKLKGISKSASKRKRFEEY